MSWLGEIWTWTVASAYQLLVLFWWATAGAFLLSAGARWWTMRRLGAGDASGSGRSVTWPTVVVRGVTASGWGDWERRARDLVEEGRETEFAVFVAVAHTVTAYVLLIPALYGKEYLPVYLVAAVLYLGLVAAGARWLDFSRTRLPEPEVGEGEELASPGPVGALLGELSGVAPRLAFGFLGAGVIAALAIQPAWTFPVEVTGGGLVPQLLNGLVGVVLAVGAWMPPVGALVVGLAVWRAGFALTGLLAFLLALPAAPQSVGTYAEWIGRKEATKLAGVFVTAAVVSGLVAAWLAGATGLELPYVYDPAQLW